jgi:membrane protease YdiL (CAAX protease family)
MGLIVAAYFVVQQLLSNLFGEAGDPPSPEVFARGVLQFGLLELAATAAGVFLLVKVSRADASDLGLPESGREIFADAALGVVATLSAMLPMYVLLSILVGIFGEVSHNPLLERLAKDATPSMLAIISFSAIVAAPIFEEFIFRLLTQGWLEKVLIPRDSSLYQVSNLDSQAPGEGPVHLPAHSEGSGDSLDLPGAGGTADAVLPTDTAASIATARTYWLPIVISSTLFALAHAGRGYGYSPAPLFLLALILGYIYQRTHRIVPCIVAHVVFNATNIALLSLHPPAGE